MPSIGQCKFGFDHQIISLLHSWDPLLTGRVRAQDMVAFSRTIGSYIDIDPTFSQSPEYRFLSEMAETIERGDPEALQEIINKWGFSHPSVVPGTYVYGMLLRIKQLVQEKGDDFS